MGKDKASRHAATRDGLFTERQVYLRGQRGGLYVTLSRPLLVGTALGMGLLAMWLIVASAGAIGGQMKLSRQAEQLAALEDDKERLVEAAKVAKRIPELEAALAAARAEREAAAAADRKPELIAARQEIESLRRELSEIRAEDAAVSARLEAGAAERTDSSAEADGLYEQLENAYREIDQMRAEKEALEGELAALRQNRPAAGVADSRGNEEVDRLLATMLDNEDRFEDERTELEIQILDLQGDLEELTQVRDELQARLDQDAVGSETGTDDPDRADDSPLIDRLERELADARAEREEQALRAGRTEADLRTKIASLERALGDAQSSAIGAAAPDLEMAAANESPARQAVRPAGPDGPLKEELDAALAEVQRLQEALEDVEAAQDAAPGDPSPDSTSTDAATELSAQLAQAKARMKQLDAALADAKLREVAIELALISVVPPPSPPAPREP